MRAHYHQKTYEKGALMSLVKALVLECSVGAAFGSIWLVTSTRMQKDSASIYGHVSDWMPAGLRKVLDGIGTSKLVREITRREKIHHQRSAIIREMPLMLDVLTLGLSSGLSFDSALELYCHRCEGILSKKMNTALLSWQIGITSRSDALEGLASEYGITSLLSFASVVSESLAFGSPLADSLERQASTIRDDQRAALEAEIEKVPVKMLIPLGTRIVPAMLIAILGPLLGPALSAW